MNLITRHHSLSRSAAALLALAGLALLAACSQDKDKRQGGTPAVPVTVATVAQKDVPVQVNSIGYVQPYSTVQIKSQINAQVMSVHFTEGQDVQQGQLLFTLDAAPFAADLHRDEATLAKDQAQLANARAQWVRGQALYKEGVVSREQADTIRTNAEALEATVKADQAAIEASRVQLQYTKIYAPLTGRTGNLMIKAGNLVKANDTPFLVTINQITPIYVQFAVPEGNLAAIKRAMAEGKLPVTATVPNQPTAAQGVLSFVDNAVDPGTGTIQLKGTFENADRKLWPGLYANTVLTLSVESNATVVPAQTLQSGQKGNYVYVVKSDRTAERRDVVVERTSGSDAVITAGLQPGETVVADGQSRVVPGQKVDFKNPSAAAAPAAPPAGAPVREGTAKGKAPTARPAGNTGRTAADALVKPERAQ